MKPFRRLREIYKSIPSIECKPNCSDCCGCSQWAKIEERNIKNG